jgi:carbamoyltransferase
VGERATTTTGVRRGGRIELNEQIRFPHSLGLLYSALTGYCGFRVNSGEYKLMGLAPYGEPRYVDLIKDRLVHVRADGSFRLNLDYFGFCHSLRMTNRRFHRLFGRGPRRPDQPLEDLDRDLAASVQKVTEEVVLRAARHVHARTQLDNLVMAGGVALNCVANGRLLREGPFERLWIQPAAGDAGGALGVALLIWHQLLGRQRQVTAGDGQRSSLLGPRFSPHQVRETLDRCGADYRVIASAAEMNCQVARLLARGNVVGRFCGPAEFGPRALGNRSILADPRVPDMQTKLNLKIKFRESFRPFAPAVLAERADEFFELPPGTDSPYMLLVGQVRGDALPAVRHVDGSARIQTVDRTGNPEFAGLLEAFDRETGCPVLVNTSLNVRGEPIVGTPADAYRCFDRTDMDALVIGDCLLVKAAHAHARGQGLHA